MRHVFKPVTPTSSLVVVTLFAVGLILATDDSLGLSTATRLFFLILAPLALYHLNRIAVSLCFVEITPGGVAIQSLFRRKSLTYAAIREARISALTGDLLIRGGGAKLTIPAATERFGELHFAVLTGLWAHQGQDEYEQLQPSLGLNYTLKPSVFERAHAAYAISAPVLWAACLGWAAGPAWLSTLPLLLVGGVLQAGMNFHGLRHLLNWYEVCEDGVIMHSLLRKRLLPANEFLTSVVRNDAQGRSLELAFLNHTVRIRFGFLVPVEELAGMLNQRWSTQASY
jgi:hypothetical protein